MMMIINEYLSIKSQCTVVMLRLKAFDFREKKCEPYFSSCINFTLILLCNISNKFLNNTTSVKQTNTTDVAK